MFTVQPLRLMPVKMGNDKADLESFSQEKDKYET